MDHKEHLELSELIIQKKKNRFSYKIKELIFSKIKTMIAENLVNETKINGIVNEAIDEGKFRIYCTIHDKFEDVDFEIKKRKTTP